MSSVTLDMQEVKTLPVLLGEQDILKTLQLMPGVQSGSEGTSGFYVRGGGPDQNLILLDGVPIYNASHLFGFFSVFNSDAIRNVELIKGGFPARYGGRLSSVLDIRMKEGNNQELKGTGSVGIISSKLTLEGPIRNENTSFLVSGRRTYIDLLTRPIIRATNGGDETGGYYFWDLNAKVNHRIDDKNRLFLSFYGGKDRAFYRFDGGNVISANELERASLSWGNAITALRWNHELNNKTFINTTATFSNYQFVVGNEFRDRETDDRDVLEYVSGIQDFGLRSDLDFTPNPNHYIKAGASATRHRFRPGVNNYTIVENSQTVIDTTFGNQDVVNYEFYAYAEDEWKISPDLTANVGVHFSGLIQDGTNFTSVQPRIALNYRVNKKHSIKAAFATMTQYLHLLTNSGIGLPTDLWLPAVDEAPPQQSNQVSIGWAHAPTPQFEVSVEGYYKHMENLIEYKNGASFFNGSREWTTKIENGIGWSYGAEVLVRKKLGEWTGWVGYTWSKSERLFDELNFGRVFPYRYDRRHDVSIAITYKPNERFDMGLVWVYGTGNSVTLEEASYFAISPSFTLNQQFTQEVNYYPDRNGYRVPAYHRMDIGFNFHKEKIWGQRTFSLGLYNAYSRQNPFFLEFSRIFDGNTGTSRQALIQYSLFPIIPSISYQFSF
ncbi:MAG: TonB-dependent receptor plug domain-containing protein [Flavobacteriales bacterium]|nr:TonB-dependent receptor plug domain-containing protein [Flavobacteriales bacterium]